MVPPPSQPRPSLDRYWLYRARRRRPRRPPVRTRGLLLLVVGSLILGPLALAACGAVTKVGGAAAIQARGIVNADRVDVADLPSLDSGMPQTATILARDGSVLAQVNDVNYGHRTYVPLSDISPALVQATVAAEDRRFYSHNGVDPLGLVRALTENAGSEGISSGASTIEMQLARNIFFPDERTEQTLSRKIKEAVAAMQLDEEYSKDQVIEGYLNIVYYGNQAYGAEAAAERYFGTSAKDLDLPEAAMLAGLPQSPSAYDPLQNFGAAKQRQGYVLDQMALDGFITRDEADAAFAEQLDFGRVAPPPTRAPHWVNYIEDRVREDFGPEALYTEGLTIKTTLDPEIQSIAEQVIANGAGVRQLGHANNSSMVVIDPRNGQILAMVGSVNFSDPSLAGQVNVSVADRQPGSSIKPLLYLAGFEHGLNPATQMDDVPTAFSAPPGQPLYQPTDFEDKFYGRVTIRDALGNSLNVPAVKTLKYIGVPALQEMARRLGITTLDDWDRHWLSLTLGGGAVKLLELTGAYSYIAREGNKIPIEPYLDVTTSHGDVLHEAADDPAGEQVVDPRVAYQLLSIMGDANARLVTFGPATPLNIGRPHMMKTGTTDDYRDTWTVGCLPQVCVGVWMGNTNNDPMLKVSSSLTAGKMWVDMMHALIDRYQYPPDPFPVPDGLVFKDIPNVGVTRPGQATHQEVFLQGHEDQVFLNMDWARPDP